MFIGYLGVQDRAYYIQSSRCAKQIIMSTQDY